MHIHAIQTGRVQVKISQVDGRGHGLARQSAPLVDRVWAPWLPHLRLGDRASRRHYFG